MDSVEIVKAILDTVKSPAGMVICILMFFSVSGLALVMAVRVLNKRRKEWYDIWKKRGENRIEK